MPLLLMGLPTKLDRRYIPESWQRITANATFTINALTKLQMVLCRWYVIFIDGIKRINFFWHTLSVCKSIGIFITDVVTHFWVPRKKMKKNTKKIHIKKYIQKKKKIRVRKGCWNYHKMARSWLRRFRNTRIEIWQ